ncbi:hypothetical protein ACQEV4_40340 [Streptomyces shenzhenensis]|uniref:hypothetical protein n=1 Tax=Streptomyces shenzhenensis TaxID=943815 RepID=UPI003D8E0E6C
MSACEMCGDNVVSRYLCGRHAAQLTKRLTELPTLYDEVAECLVPRRSGWGEIVATKAAAGPRSPVNEDILDTVNTARAAEVMHSWRVDVQRVRWPTHGAPPYDGLAADCRWLGMELEWIAANYPAAGDLAREVRDLETQARTIVGDPAPRAQQLGTCVAVTDDQGAVCGAAISRLPGQTRVRCRQCHTVYESALDWAQFQHYQPAQSA